MQEKVLASKGVAEQDFELRKMLIRVRNEGGRETFLYSNSRCSRVNDIANSLGAL